MKQVARLADAVLIGAGGLCLLFLAYNLFRHGWARHYLALIAVGLLLFAAVRLRSAPKINLALLLVSTVCSVYLAEVLIGSVLLSPTRFKTSDWMNFPFDWNTKLAVDRFKEEKKGNAGFDMRPRMEVIQDLRRQGVQAVPHVFPTLLFDVGPERVWTSRYQADGRELLPLGGLSRATTVLCNESGEYLIYEADEHGFHNPPGLWTAGTAQVLVVGDSFAHGACVPSPHNLAAVVRAQYPATVSLGVSGDGPLTELATLKEYGPFLKPKAVLWLYYEDNDFRDLDQREKFAPILMRYLEPGFSQGLVSRQAEIDRLLSTYIEDSIQAATSAGAFHLEAFLKLTHVRDAVRRLFVKVGTEHGQSTELTDQIRKDSALAQPADRELYRLILQEAQRATAAWGGRLYFVYLPAWSRYAVPDLANQNRDAMLTIVHELRLPLIDLHPTFAAQPDPLALFPSRRYAHYNIDGHRLVGQRMAAALAADPALSKKP